MVGLDAGRRAVIGSDGAVRSCGPHAEANPTTESSTSGHRVDHGPRHELPWQPCTVPRRGNCSILRDGRPGGEIHDPRTSTGHREGVRRSTQESGKLPPLRARRTTHAGEYHPTATRAHPCPRAAASCAGRGASERTARGRRACVGAVALVVAGEHLEGERRADARGHEGAPRALPARRPVGEVAEGQVRIGAGARRGPEHATGRRDVTACGHSRAHRRTRRPGPSGARGWEARAARPAR